jgi:hypothetical protein
LPDEANAAPVLPAEADAAPAADDAGTPSTEKTYGPPAR